MEIFALGNYLHYHDNRFMEFFTITVIFHLYFREHEFRQCSGSTTSVTANYMYHSNATVAMLICTVPQSSSRN